MDLLRPLCFVSFLVASLAIGLRLLWMARKSRQVPELAVGLLGACLALGGDPAPIARELSFCGTTTGTLLAYGWASSESFAFYAVMRRRRRIGLGDPLVTNRLLLWGISWSSSALISAIYIAVHLSGQGRALGPAVSIVSSILILVAALGAWLAFFPPAPYRRRFEFSTEA